MSRALSAPRHDQWKGKGHHVGLEPVRWEPAPAKPVPSRACATPDCSTSSAVRLWGWGRSDVQWPYESSSTLGSYLQVGQCAPGCGFLNHHPCCGGLLVMQLAFGSTHSPINYPINSGFTKLHLGLIVSSVCRQCPI